MTPAAPENDRIDELERRVRDLTDRLARLEPRRGRPRSERARLAWARKRAIRWGFRGEQWTGRVGLALLFLGLVFLFRYSVEQGWLTPLVRVAFGAALGAAFLVAGTRSARTRPSYGALLLAGSIAIFYATGWAASYLYQLIDRPVGFLWMAAVTGLAWNLARTHQQPALASLGAMGGFATPFLLRPGSETVLEIVAYTILVVLWTAYLYFSRHWRSLLWTYLVGGLGVLGIAAFAAEGGDRALVQIGLAITWGAGAALPFVLERGRAGVADPHRGALIPFALELRALGAGGTAAALALTGRMWSLSDDATGLLFLLAAAAYGTFAWIGTRTPNFVARSAAPVAAALAATATFLLLPEGPARWTAVSLQALLYLRAGRAPRFRGVEWVAHGLFGVLALSLLRSAVVGVGVAFDPRSLAYLFGIALAAVGSGFLRDPRLRRLYRVAAHVLALVWIAEEFGPLASGSEWVTVAWGVYGVVMMLFVFELGRRGGSALLGAQALAASALALTVGKLLLIDMAQTSALIRIPLFLGAGLTLLALSSLFQRAGRVPDAPSRAPGKGRNVPEPAER